MLDIDITSETPAVSTLNMSVFKVGVPQLPNGPTFWQKNQLLMVCRFSPSLP